MSATTRVFRSWLAAVLGLLFWGCAGSGNEKAPQLSNTGQHPANWLNTHATEYSRQPDQCATCHGSTTDPGSTGGISKVSCFKCHQDGPGHPDGWRAGLQHGRLGAQSANGMASCTTCHGDSFNGGSSSVSCTQCHTRAPHPNGPWLDADPQRSSHDATAVSNAAQCWRCHAGGASSPVAGPLAPAGTTPGCYNNTLCHGTP